MRLVATLGGIAIVGVPIVAALLLRQAPGATVSTEAPAAAAVAPAGFPAPPSGAVVYSRQAGSDALALGIVPRRGSILLQASIIGPQGHGSRGLTVDFVVQRMSARATACGPGCYRAALATNGRPDAVDVAVRRGSRTIHWRVALPATWPPSDASTLIARAERVWRSLQSLSFQEQLASDSRPPLESTWRVEAPDRVAYQVKHGWAGVIIGERRWDRSPGVNTLGRLRANAAHPAGPHLGWGGRRARARRRHGPGPPGLAHLLLRSRHTRLVRDSTRAQDTAHARDTHDHGEPLHVRRLQRLQHSARNQAASSVIDELREQQAEVDESPRTAATPANVGDRRSSSRSLLGEEVIWAVHQYAREICEQQLLSARGRLSNEQAHMTRDLIEAIVGRLLAVPEARMNAAPRPSG